MRQAKRKFKKENYGEGFGSKIHTGSYRPEVTLVVTGSDARNDQKYLLTEKDGYRVSNDGESKYSFFPTGDYYMPTGFGIHGPPLMRPLSSSGEPQRSWFFFSNFSVLIRKWSGFGP